MVVFPVSSTTARYHRSAATSPATPTMTTTSTTATSTVAGTTTKHKTSIEFPDVDSALEKATEYWDEKFEALKAEVTNLNGYIWIIWTCFLLSAFSFLILLCLGCYACCNCFNWHSVKDFFSG